MSSKNSTTFHSNLSKLSKGSFAGTQRDNAAKGFIPASGINFGKASRSALATSETAGFDWTGLAKAVTSGSGASFLKASSPLGGVTSLGLGPIISGITSLFGGHDKTLPALKAFQLPEAANQTVHLQGGSSGTTSSAGVHVHVQAIDSQSFLSRSNDIARAVKTAMLNSHSLNDVVSEL